jgi:hypothetical protein
MRRLHRDGKRRDAARHGMPAAVGLIAFREGRL